MNTKQWRQLIARVKKAMPIDSPVYVRRYPAKKQCGATRFDGRCFRIRIDSKLDDAAQRDSLLHEYCHAVAISQAHEHKGNWGEIYAALYTAVE
jgi:hypothetical protein